MISPFAIDAGPFKVLWDEATLRERSKTIWPCALCTRHGNDLSTRLNQDSVDVRRPVHSHLVRRNRPPYEINVSSRTSEKCMSRLRMNEGSKLKLFHKETGEDVGRSRSGESESVDGDDGRGGISKNKGPSYDM